MLTGKRLLIVEAEALIALDMQRIFEDAGAGRVEIARDYDDLHALEGGLAANYDIVVLSPPRELDAEARLLDRLTGGPLAIVLCTADLAVEHAARPGIEIVVKPFADDELLAATTRALHRKITSGCVS